ncbi:MAG: flagellar hook-associated protein FlgK [Pseudomonas sp. PGPPP4]|uniref:flagellar hook-associated protein FlgK n=1 Tax=Pseudomonas TaxID=286 RepID=UPI000BC5911A|nr:MULTISPECIES: flagellar hook-associated protein FlgK [Pseudomonas]NMZ63067.1 flagellar hook-associated protein FlgK [Pseudomonas oryzihabitans]OYT81976.1 MAG: flagellar hook-associated protein FlgK [Pseudomonas sp. PGPPP4]
MASLISIGLSGLQASQTALSTTGNNITNVDTAGYSRQLTSQSAAAAQNVGLAYVGTGTTVADVRRVYSQYLTTQLQSGTALDNEAQTYVTAAKSVDSLLADSTTGISTALSSFFSSLQTASATPTDSASRSLVLTSATTLSQRFNSLYSQLSDQNSYVNTQLSSSATQVNTLANKIAQYNQSITAASANGATPNSLLDARDQAITELNKLVGVSVVNQDGNYNVYIGSGQPLVVGGTVSTLSAQASTGDPSQFSLTLQMPSGTSVDVTEAITGGSMTGMVRYRDEIVNPSLNALGRLALVASDAINSQQAQGLDLDGTFGTKVFNDINSASAVASRSIGRATNSDTYANLNVTIADSSALGTSDYKVVFTSATDYSVTRLSDGKDLGSHSLNTSPADEIEGLQLGLRTGSVTAGDTFTVQPTRLASNQIKVAMTDANDLAFAAPLAATSSASNIGTGTVSSPTLTTKLSVYDSTSASNLATSVQNAMPVKLKFAAAASDGSQGYTVYDASGNSIGTGSIVAGQSNKVTVSIAANGSTVPSAFDFQVTLAGNPSNGDTFSVAFNTSGSSDNTNALSLLGLQTSATVGTASMTNTYSSLVETVGAQTSQASLDASATSAILTQAQTNQSSVSGVNLDEEAANLIKFQQYYTASAKIIEISQTVFNTLIQAF